MNKKKKVSTRYDFEKMIFKIIHKLSRYSIKNRLEVNIESILFYSYATAAGSRANHKTILYGLDETNAAIHRIVLNLIEIYSDQNFTTQTTRNWAKSAQ